MDTSGDLFIISAPSGAGKTSLVKSLLQSDLGLNLSISHTTRSPRSSEVDGEDYHFVSRETFQRMLNNGEFLESAEVYGNFYGTSEKWIHEKILAGQDIVLEIDCIFFAFYILFINQTSKNSSNDKYPCCIESTLSNLKKSFQKINIMSG